VLLSWETIYGGTKYRTWCHEESLFTHRWKFFRMMHVDLRKMEIVEYLRSHHCSSDIFGFLTSRPPLLVQTYAKSFERIRRDRITSERVQHERQPPTPPAPSGLQRVLLANFDDWGCAGQDGIEFARGRVTPALGNVFTNPWEQVILIRPSTRVGLCGDGSRIPTGFRIIWSHFISSPAICVIENCFLEILILHFLFEHFCITFTTKVKKKRN